MLDSILCGLSASVFQRVFQVSAKLAGGQALKCHFIFGTGHVPVRSPGRQIVALEVNVLVAGRAF